MLNSIPKHFLEGLNEDEFYMIQLEILSLVVLMVIVD